MKTLKEILKDSNKSLLNIVDQLAEIEISDIDKWKIYKIHSGYQDRLKLRMGKDSYTIKIFNKEKVLTVCNRDNDFEPFDKQVSSKVLKEIIEALNHVKKDNNLLGTIHYPKKGSSKLILWDFYNYKIYYNK